MQIGVRDCVSPADNTWVPLTEHADPVDPCRPSSILWVYIVVRLSTGMRHASLSFCRMPLDGAC